MFTRVHGFNNITPVTSEYDDSGYFPYIAYAWNETDGVIDEVYSFGPALGAAYLANKYGLYSFSSYRFGGYLMGVRIHPDNDEYERESIINRYRMSKRGTVTYIDVAMNPAYFDNH